MEWDEILFQAKGWLLYSLEWNIIIISQNDQWLIFGLTIYVYHNHEGSATCKRPSKNYVINQIATPHPPSS